MIYSPAAMFYVLRFGAPKVVLDFAYPSLQSVCCSRKALIQRNYIWLGSAILHLYIIFVIYICILLQWETIAMWRLSDCQSSVFGVCNLWLLQTKLKTHPHKSPCLSTHAARCPSRELGSTARLSRLRHLPGWKDILIVLPLPRPLSVSEPEDFCPKIFKAVFRNQTEQTRQDIKWIFRVRYHISSYSPLPYWI